VAHGDGLARDQAVLHVEVAADELLAVAVGEVRRQHADDVTRAPELASVLGVRAASRSAWELGKRSVPEGLLERERGVRLAGRSAGGTKNGRRGSSEVGDRDR
jgi:hypothetical protein